jgi:hypothetical protein
VLATNDNQADEASPDRCGRGDVVDQRGQPVGRVGRVEVLVPARHGQQVCYRNIRPRPHDAAVINQ